MAEIRGLSFTDEQTRAVTELKRNLAITAGAGSGKTRVLTERYLEILFNEEEGLMYQKDALDKIVAITFTNKAASEMKERIRSRLEEYLSSKLSNLEGKEKNWITYILDNLAKARISTIHSFCRELLRDNLFKVGLKEDFEIVEGIERDNLVREAVVRVIDEIRANKDHPLYNNLWDLTYRYGKRNLYSILEEMLAERQKVANFISEIGAGGLAAKLNQVIRDCNFKELKSYVEEEEIRSKINRLGQLKAVNESPGVKTVKGIAKIGSELFSSWDEGERSREELVDLHLKLLSCFYDFERDKDLKIYHDMKAADWEGGNDVKKEAYNLFKELKELIPGAGSLPLTGEEEERIEIINDLLKLYQPLKEEYQTLKLDQGLLDFVDLEQKTAAVLGENYQLVEELRFEIDFMLVDEFQDTNQLQWDIIRPLVTTDRDFSKLAPGELFIVGDPKQSIYGFRRADVRIFKQVMEQIEKANRGEKLTLQKNFRSGEEIIDFVNYIFQNIFPPTEDEADEYDVAHQSLTFGREVKYRNKIDKRPDTHIEVLLTEDKSDDDYSKGEHEGRQIAEKINWLVEESKKRIFKDGKLQPVDYGDIAILMKTRTRLKEYEAALEEAGIDYQTVKGIGFYQRQEIYDIYLALRVLTAPEDEVAVFGLFRSPLFGFSDDKLFKLMIKKGEDSLLEEIFINYPEIEAKFIRWQRVKKKSGVDKLIDIILSDCGAYASYRAGVNGEQKLANFEKLIAEAAQFSSSKGNNLYLFLQRLERLMEEEEGEGNKELAGEDSGAVKLMTIYAAKGKEFPVVFLVDLNHPGNSQAGNFICEEIAGEEQIGLKYYTEGLKQDKTNSYKIIKEERKKRDQFEGKRVFYVGVTRAEEMLFLSGTLRLTSNQNVTLNHSLKWLIQGLGYDSEDVAEFLASSSSSRREKLQIKTGEKKKTLEVQLTKNNTEISKLEAAGEFKEIKAKKEVELLTENLKEEVTSEVISPSSLSKDEEEKTRKDSPAISFAAGNRASLKGTLVHKGLELLVTGRGLDVDYLFTSHSTLGDYPGLKQEVVNTLERIKSCPQFKQIISRECKVEVEFYFKQDNGNFVSGSIDLLFKDGVGSWGVLDWKTNWINEAADIKEYKAKYERQLETYKEAAAKITGQKEVKAYLYFTEAEEGNRLQKI